MCALSFAGFGFWGRRWFGVAVLGVRFGLVDSYAYIDLFRCCSWFSCYCFAISWWFGLTYWWFVMMIWCFWVGCVG